MPRVTLPDSVVSVVVDDLRGATVGDRVLRLEASGRVAGVYIVTEIELRSDGTYPQKVRELATKHAIPWDPHQRWRFATFGGTS